MLREFCRALGSIDDFRANNRQSDEVLLSTLLELSGRAMLDLATALELPQTAETGRTLAPFFARVIRDEVARHPSSNRRVLR
jgi:hypothetical protein